MPYLCIDNLAIRFLTITEHMIAHKTCSVIKLKNKAQKLKLVLDISVFENCIILMAGHSKCDVVLFVCAYLTPVCNRVPQDTFVFVLCVFVLLMLRSLTSEGFEKSRSLNNIAGTLRLSPVTSPCPIHRSRSPIPSIF